MKNIYNICIILIGIVIITGCEDDFLDQPSKDDIVDTAFWNSKEDLVTYMNQFYVAEDQGVPVFNTWSRGAWNGGMYWSDLDSDNYVSGTPDRRLRGDNTITSENDQWNFNLIRRINNFFDNYDRVQATEAEIANSVGEAHFFRAFFYFRLVKQYGDVPYIDKVLAPDAEELFAARTPRNEVVDKILADLDQAIEKLNSKTKGQNRVSKEVAMLFKARVALYEGTWEKYHALKGTPFMVEGSDGTKYIEAARDAANALIQAGTYKLHYTGQIDQDYFQLFNREDYSDNEEVMLWSKFDRSIGYVHNGQRYLAGTSDGKGVSGQLVNSYLCTDGKTISSSPLYEGDSTLADVFKNRDARLSATVYGPGDPWTIDGGIVTAEFQLPSLRGGDNTRTGFQIRKGSTPDLVHKTSSDVGATSNPIFRYGEALLIYAEAKAELGTLTQSDVDATINLLRDRAGVAHMVLGNIEVDPNWDFPSLSPVINEVRRERRVELAMEGHRFNDLARWAAFDELIIGRRIKGAWYNEPAYKALYIENNPDTPDDYVPFEIGSDIYLDENGNLDPHQISLPSGYQFDPMRDYLLPIPVEQIGLNDNLTQNPGWQ